MKDYYSLKIYTALLILRAVWCLLICVVAVTGMGIAATNDIIHNTFEFCYFLICFLVELSAALYYLCLFRKQRHQLNLERVNKMDCLGSCVLIFVRLGFHIALSLFIVIRIHQMNLKSKSIQWTNIFNLTIVIMVFTLIHIIGFIFGVIYQPLEYIREPKFNNILDEI